MKKTIVIFLILISFFLPQRADAQFAVIDNAAVALLAAIAGTSGVSAEADVTLQFKETVLDGIAKMLAQLVVRELTASVVNWINTGFEGNPSFVTNPGGFFLDIGDQVIGKMIESDGDLNFLCSQFSIDVRLALAFKYQPFKKRVSCTLSDVLGNVEGAIGGFQSNFLNGGWPAFVSLTVEPQNNVYGAYVQADSEIMARIGDKQFLKTNELNQGRGFLSWEKCELDQSSDPNFIGPVEKCEIQTPGSVIANQIDMTNAGPLTELHLADEINEIVNALFAQMVTKVLTTGLKGLSGNGASDPQSYINQIEQEQAQNNVQLQTVKTTILGNIDSLINGEVTYQGILNQTYSYVLNTQKTYEEAKLCFIQKLNDPTRNLSSAQVSYGNSAVGGIESKIQTEVIPTSLTLIPKITDMDTIINKLKLIKSTVTTAKTVNEISGVSNEYSSLVSSGILKTENDVLQAKTEQAQIKLKMDELKRDADRQRQLCDIFPNNIRNSFR